MHFGPQFDIQGHVSIVMKILCTYYFVLRSLRWENLQSLVKKFCLLEVAAPRFQFDMLLKGKLTVSYHLDFHLFLLVPLNIAQLIRDDLQETLALEGLKSNSLR